MQPELLAKKILNIAVTVDHAKNGYVLIFDTIDYDVFPDRKTPQANPKVAVAGSPQVRMADVQQKRGQ